jgi:hypothetical protein
MPKIYDEQIDFKQGGDNGQNTAGSIQPIADAEPLWSVALGRSPENLRKRTEVLRAAIDELRYYADYDRSLVLRSNATFTFIEPDPLGDPGRKILTMSGDDLWIYPTLTPGALSGGRHRGARMFLQVGPSWVPYSGTAGVNDLTFTASAQYTGMRGYADADDFAIDVNGVSLGANRLTLTLVADPAVAGGVGTMVATVTGTPKVNITLTYGTLTPTTVNDIIAFVNGDLTSQGTYGLAHLIRASTTSLGTGAPTPFVDGVFQGGYDAEAYKVVLATLSAFFNAMDAGTFPNRLREGEGLALSYTPGPVERGVATAKGGRRQSLFDWPSSRIGASSSNVAPSPGWNLFNTGREPEKIPGSVPIGKMIDGKFVFIDGTIVDSAPISLGESSITLDRLAATAPVPGAALVSYGGSGPWNADASASANPDIPAGTVQATLDSVVSDLASEAATDSGTRRVGGEPIAGSVSALNVAQNVTAGSVREQLSQILNATAGLTQGGGVNARVSEYGHVLKGPRPITKDLSVLSLPSAGGQRFSGLMTGGTFELIAAPARTAREEMMDFLIQPIGGVTLAGVPVVLPAESVVIGSAADRLLMTGVNIAARYPFIQALFPTMNTYSQVQPANKAFSGCIVVLITGAVAAGNDGDGYYYFEKCTNGVTFEIQLKRLDGTAAVFTGTNFAAAVLVFCNARVVGNNPSSHRERVFHISENFAEKVIAMPGLTQPWVETYHANMSSVGADAIKGSYMLSNKAVWKPTEATPRDTDNILGTTDKGLLDGVEDGIAVNASLSHHHGLTSSRIEKSTNTPLTFIGAAASAITLSQLDDYIMLPTPPPGYTATAAIMLIKMNLDSTAAALALASIAARVSASYGSTYNGANALMAIHQQYLKQNAGGVADLRDFYVEVTLQPDAARQIAFHLTTSTPDVNLVVAGLEVSCRFLVLSKTTMLDGQSGTAASIGGVIAAEQTVTGLTGMTAGSVGRFLELSNAASAENNGVFLITAYNSPTSVNIRNPLGTVGADGNNPNIIWSERIVN